MAYVRTLPRGGGTFTYHNDIVSQMMAPKNLVPPPAFLLKMETIERGNKTSARVRFILNEGDGPVNTYRAFALLRMLPLRLDQFIFTLLITLEHFNSLMNTRVPMKLSFIYS